LRFLLHRCFIVLQRGLWLPFLLRDARWRFPGSVGPAHFTAAVQIIKIIFLVFVFVVIGRSNGFWSVFGLRTPPSMTRRPLVYWLARTSLYTGGHLLFPLLSELLKLRIPIFRHVEFSGYPDTDCSSRRNAGGKLQTMG
jgi:hypothetical protein